MSAITRIGIMYPSFLSFLVTHLPGRLAPEPEWQVR
jgi:hypothetical protein